MNVHLASSGLLDTAANFARLGASVLIASVWEGGLLAAAAGLCLTLVPRTTARFRFLIWIAAFTALVALPFLSASLSGHSASALAATALHLELDSRWSYALAGLWLAAILVRSAHLSLQARNLRLLWNSAVPVPSDSAGAPHIYAEIRDAARSRFFLQLKTRKVQLCTSTDLDRPSVIGFFAPRILIPAWLFQELTPLELHQIVLHELEHLHRRDDWLNLVQKICLVLFPLNPALFWIDRRLSTERELACDDGVLRYTHAPRAYATCLTTLAERRLRHRSHSPLTVLALGVMGAIRRSDFTRRIESILAPGFAARASLSLAYTRASAVLLLAGVLGSAVMLAHAPQLVSFNSAAQTDSKTQAALASASPYLHLQRESTAAKFENAAFRPVHSVAGKSPAPHRVTKPKAKPRRVSPVTQIAVVNPVVTHRPDKPWMVLTSWRQQSTPRPVLLTLPDGRTFLATYTASPDQSGWLLIQL